MSNFTIRCTSTFKSEYTKILSKHRHYGSLGDDLYSFFNSQSFESLFEQQQFIDNKAPKYRLIKLRLPNSGARKSEREGFRLYYNILSEDKSVNLLYIYPKTGPLACESLNSRFIKLETIRFAQERTAGLLTPVSLFHEEKLIRFD